MTEEELEQQQIKAEQDAANKAALAWGAVMLPWRPISELDKTARYGDEAGFLLKAPELVDLDCNVHGIGLGYFQDGRDVPCNEHGAIWGDNPEQYDGWLACKWNMQNDEWYEVKVTPTHYIRLTGV